MPLGGLSFSLQRRSRYFSAKLQCRSKSRFFLHRLDLKIVLWLQPGSKLRTAPFWSFIPGASKFCCGCSHTQNIVVRHLFLSLVIINIIQTWQVSKAFWNCSFFDLGGHHRYFFKNDRFHKLFETVPFCLSMTDFHNPSYFQGYTQILLRSWIHWFYIYFRIVVFPMENHTFCYVDGFDVFLLHRIGLKMLL